MASQFVRKITDTTISEPIKETTTNGDLIITTDDKVLINLNGNLKDLTAGKDPANTKLLPAVARDFNYLALHMKTYQGLWYVRDEGVVNGPTANWTWAVIEVISGNSEKTGIIRTTRFGAKDTYTTNINGGNANNWVLIADDKNVVHNTGNETIAGNKTLTGLTTMLTGNYGFRVTSSGFEKTTDGGKTWLAANI